MNPFIALRIRRKAVWGSKVTFAALLLTLLGFVPTASAKTHLKTDVKPVQSRHARKAETKKPGGPGRNVKVTKLDAEIEQRANRGNPNATSKVIVLLQPGAQMPEEFKRYMRGGKLGLIDGQPLELPNRLIRRLEQHPDFFRIVEDRPIGKFNYRTTVTTGIRTVQQTLGYTGKGIGVAVIDSGVATWHDDLTQNATTTTLYPYGDQRVTKFVDFVNGQALPYDDNGHGSHVAGIILGNGYDSYGKKSGSAPDASLIALKVLDANGQGTISNIIAALGWVAQNAATYNIRVVNMSVGAGIHESYWTDPLTLAAKRVTDLGITVVVAAGNMGKNAAGLKQYGGITAPANAPWVLSVGASSTMGTLTRTDDTMASFSSRGPTFKDFGAKPDLVAPGVGTVSLAVPGSTFYTSKTQYLVNGNRPTGALPYLSLSGTSMAAPVVAGTVAAMLQANPSLTPNLIKAILQYTAQPYPGYKALEQGAGFLNALGAVRLARFYATAQPGTKMPVQRVWSRTVIWGNHKLSGGYLNPKGNAWAANIVWGTAKTLGDTGDNIVWGTDCADGTCDNIVWGTADDSGDNIVWGTAVDDTGANIVWGTACADVACGNIVWGTAVDDNIVWGTDCGGADCDNIVWGTADAVDNIVWGTADPADNIVWGTSGADNIVWGTSSDADVSWGADAGDDAAVLFDDGAPDVAPDLASELGDPVTVTSVTDPATGVTTTTVTNDFTGEIVSTTVTAPPPQPSTTTTDPTTGVITTTTIDPVAGTTTVTTTDPATGVTTTTVTSTNGTLGVI